MNPSVSVTPDRILQFAWGYAPPLVLEAAIHHRVFDVLDAGAMTVPEVAASTGASERGLRAIMNMLAGFGFLAMAADGAYSLTPESEAFLVSTRPGFMGGMLRHGSTQLIPKWLKLNEIVATGTPVEGVNEEAVGGDFFAEFVVDIFPLSYPSARVLAEAMDWGASGETVHILDLAAGSGVWSIALMQSSSRVHATVVDWPEVIPVTRKTVARFGLEERLTSIEGDLLAVDFGGGYVLATLGHILHSEGEARSRALLAKTFQALAPGGTIAIAEFLVNSDRTGPLNGLIFGVNMLVNTQHGDTYSFEEIGDWLRAAGFTEVRQLQVPGPSPLILATRP